MRFVDNIGFFGSRVVAADAMVKFFARTRHCGAVFNDEDNSPRCCYDFLGEHYNHATKERCLTAKSIEKLHRVAALLKARLAKKGKMTCRQAMAIMGQLLYCAEILDIGLANYTAALGAYAALAAEAGRLCSWDHKVHLPTAALTQLSALTAECTANTPVNVASGKRIDCGTRPTTTIWVDASLWGWGAVIIGPDGATRHLSAPWTQADHEEAQRQGGWLGFSVFAEPMALRRAVCCCKLAAGTALTIWTDHASMATVAQRTREQYSLVASYNAALQLLGDLQTADIAVTVGSLTR